MNGGKEFLGCSKDFFHSNLSPDQQVCDQENWQSFALSFIQELKYFGFPFFHDEESRFTNYGQTDFVVLVNGAWWILQNYKLGQNKIKDLHSQVHRVTNEIQRLHECLDRLKENHNSKIRLVHELTEKEEHGQVLLKEEKDNSKNCKEEVRKLVVLMQQKDSQFQHELKRKDQENFSLKERLVKTMALKNYDPWNEISIQNFVESEKPKPRQKWKIPDLDQTKSKTNLNQRMATELEKRCKKLVQENQDTRQSFFEFCESVSNNLGLKLEHDFPNYSLVIQLPFAKSKKMFSEMCVKILQVLDRQLKRKNLPLADTLAGSQLHEKEHSSDGVYNDIKMLHEQGKRVLALNEEIQKHDQCKIDNEKKNLEEAKSEMEKTKLYLLALCNSNSKEVEFQIESKDLPNWSLGNVSATTVVSSENQSLKSRKWLATVGPQYPNSGRPPSRPQSRSHSRNRNRNSAIYSGSPKSNGRNSAVLNAAQPRFKSTGYEDSSPLVSMRKSQTPRPRSANMSTLRSSATCSGFQNKLRTASISPSSQSRTLSLSKLPNLNNINRNDCLKNTELKLSNKLNGAQDQNPRNSKSKTDASPEEKEFSTQLERLGDLILRRQQSSNSTETSDSEMEEHLINVRRALLKQKTFE